MCTVVVWADNGQAVVSSRNMDWFEQMDTRLWSVPAGRKQIGAGPGDPNPTQWTSKYGSVVASVFNIGTADGVNSEGLAAHLLWLAPSVYGTRTAEVPGLTVSLWAQYYLDNFATVAEAVKDFEQNPYQVASAKIGNQQATVHLQISDATGDVAVFESLDGKIVIHHGPQYNVLTNSPIFSEQLENLKKYDGFGGTDPLPGTTEAADRFVRAAYYHDRLVKPDSVEMALAEILSVTRNVAQPYANPAKGQPYAPTIWRTAIDHTNKRYYFETTYSPYLVWLDLESLDLSESGKTMMLDLPNMKDHIGEQNDALVDTELFKFSLPAEH